MLLTCFAKASGRIAAAPLRIRLRISTAGISRHVHGTSFQFTYTSFGWRRGVVVSRVRQWTKLTHVGPGYNWYGWPSSGGYTISGCNQPTRSTRPCIPPGSLNWVPASAGVKAGMSPLPGGRWYCVIAYGTWVPVAGRLLANCYTPFTFPLPSFIWPLWNVYQRSSCSWTSLLVEIAAVLTKRLRPITRQFHVYQMPLQNTNRKSYLAKLPVKTRQPRSSAWCMFRRPEVPKS